MGIYLNPNAEAFKMDKNTDIYVDKSLVLTELNKLLGTRQNFVCMSRARRFGKSMAGNMISAYYSKGCDTKEIFSKMKIGDVPGYEDNLNKFNVIKLDLNGWYQRSLIEENRTDVIKYIQEEVLEEFREAFPSIEFKQGTSIATNIQKVYGKTGEKFIIIIDEYDVLVRERVAEKVFDSYLQFLNSLFKDTTLRPAIALAYITGILPIVRDKVQSKLNEFTEYSMVDAQQFAGLIGFTHEDVDDLCNTHGIDKDECARWYDGYKLSESVGVFNPLSVVSAVRRKEFGSYWSATSTFEVLKDYISMNFDGIREDIISMMSGTPVPVKVKDFRNKLDDITNKDNVFTYLIHLGYLSYNRKNKTCKIPNEEVREEWVSAIDYDDNYAKVIEIVNASKKLLDATINGDEDAVANALDAAHTEVTSNLTYNDEHCFQSAICLAYFYANTRYTLVKELPTGKGYADLALIPFLPNIPAMVIELKHNKSSETALQQIKDRKYDDALKHYRGNLLFVGINYDEKTKKHECKIEKLVL